MKRLFIYLVAACAAICAGAQPILVGHRGSGYGLENSEESFRRGVQLGYKYLETDVKFTKDNILVCSHDDDTKRLGGTKTLATSTLEELQSETLSQTRNGEKCTGRLCSMKEYLQICKEGNVGPLIELKWTDGINSNDQSKIPLLIAAIEAEGMRDKCIILTSMKPCLEYIRTHYPDIELQFLTGQYWANHFDWCVQWGIDADIQAGYFDKSTVNKYHEKGLKVNMWTTNDDAGYKTYGNMGCDFITTDRLDGHNLPELDPEILKPHNTVDYPHSSFTPAIKGTYDIEPLQSAAWPADFSGKSVRRAVADGNGGWYVLLNGTAGEIALYHVGADGTPAAMSLSGIAGGQVALNDIALTADGKLVGCNLVADLTDTPAPWTVYSWASVTAMPEVLVKSGDLKGGAGAAMAVTGRAGDMKVYVAAAAAESKRYAIYGLEVKNGKIGTRVCASDPSYTTVTWGENISLKVAPRSQNQIIVSSAEHTAREYFFEWADGPMTSVGDFLSASGYRTEAASFMRYGTRVYSVVPDCASGAAVYDVTRGLNKAVRASDAFEVCETMPAAVATSMKCGTSGGATFAVLVEGRGIYTFAFDTPRSNPEVEDLGLKLERMWIRSNTTDNVPEHINGDNAQQGTAVRGIFYVNDCVDRLLYIFDSTGCIGSVPGGAGWGCTRDDAGNIIIRDDKSTGATHKFMIYPAGIMPGTDAVAAKLEVTTELEGQTNFISASGDVLGESGIIYLFPNKQTAVATIMMADGKCVATSVSDDLSFAGSTAGYVCPMGNDRENWIYLERKTNINYYRGGENTSILPGRPSTSAPGRNSTGGCAYYRHGSNEIFAHNSGANYLGGFTVRDLSRDEVITTVTPIGTLGYVDGGNRSTFNWLIIEPNGDYDMNLYQYCPANGMAMYRLYNPERASCVSLPAVPETITLQGSVVMAAGASSVEVYSVAGQHMMKVAGSKADVSALAPGMYIVRTDDGRSLKIAI